MRRISRAGRAPVAQLDRALPSEGRGQGFESLRARHDFQGFDRKGAMSDWGVASIYSKHGIHRARRGAAATFARMPAYVPKAVVGHKSELRTASLFRTAKCNRSKSTRDLPPYAWSRLALQLILVSRRSWLKWLRNGKGSVKTLRAKR